MSQAKPWNDIVSDDIDDIVWLPSFDLCIIINDIAPSGEQTRTVRGPH
jgi:hypothetical protein